MALLAVDDLTFSYPGDRLVLSRITLSMGEGENLLVVGDNGSGKSTLGRVIAGLLVPTSGTIRINDVLPHTLPLVQRCRVVSYVGQVTHLSILTSSIISELRSFSNSSGSPTAESIYYTWAGKLLLPVDTTLNPRDLSTPELWRFVLFLYGIILKPTVLIVDEIFAAGDERQLGCAREVMAYRGESKLGTLILYQRSLPLAFDAVFTLSSSRLSSGLA